MTTDQKVDALQHRFKEIAFGYNDSGCFWSMQYGPRGAGNMVQGCGKHIHSEESEFSAAVDFFYAQLIGEPK